MKKLFSILILISLTISLSAKTVKVLAIGNSFSEDAIEQYLYELAAASDDDIIIGNLYIGGSALSLHKTNSIGKVPAYSYRKIVSGVKRTTESVIMDNALKDEDWDYISFQQVSQNSGQYNTYFPYIDDLITYAKGKVTNPEVKFILHATWAYAQNSTHSGFANYGNNQTTMFNAIVDATTRVVQDAEMDLLIPAGTAIQNGRTSSLGDVFCRDGYHLELSYGRFTAACTWYEKLFDKSAIENSYAPASISPFQAMVAKHAAHNAVLKPTEVTSLADLINNVETVPFTKQINLSFASVPTVVAWNVLADYNLNATVENLKDIENNYTAVSVTVTDRFGGINPDGPTSTNTDMLLPSGATTQSFFGNTGNWGGYEPTAAITFSSLDSQEAYDFNIFASRMNASDNREAKYIFSGLTKNDTILYLNASNNTSKTVKALGIKPTSEGKITIKMEPGPNNNNSYGFYYISALNLAPSTELESGIAKVNDGVYKVYPNPFSEVIHVQVDNSIDKIKLFGIDGREIRDIDYSNTDNTIQISTQHLHAGFYVLVVGDKTYNIIKNK